MVPGLSGSLLSHDALMHSVPRELAGQLGERHREAAFRRFRAFMTEAQAALGPASSSRAVFDRVAAPFAAALQYVVSHDAGPADIHLRAWLCDAAGARVAAMLVTPWGSDGWTAWREAVLHGIGGGVRWCLCVTGPSVRLVDARRTYSRRYAEFDLGVAAEDPHAFAALWGLLRAGALRESSGGRSTLDTAVRLSEQHRADVRASLQHGVHRALHHLLDAFVRARRRRAHAPEADILLDESLIVVYRILFLLFAEARGLVPQWHPVYRDGYTIESLRAPAETHPRPAGLWESLQAIARLAHRGCRAGTLRVPPFNGRLFSPSHAPLADALPLDDAAVRDALVALTTVPRAAGVQRIAYADLGVEQLGGVYERILDFDPAVSGGARPTVTFVRAERRKATGSFYTPRPLTEYVVRRTLAPLVQDASPEQILRVRVVDPAMGSGAFLVAACRYLASAYEAALVREGGLAPGDIVDSERAAFRRAIAQRCLFGVDINPMAVQLGRLSLWLATLAADRPLTFLDHHLRTGNSLLGASLEDITRRPFARSSVRTAALPLFDDDAFDSALQDAVGPRRALAEEPGDTLDQVRAKERLLARLDRDDGPLAGWKKVADAWCARWFPDAGKLEAEQMRAARRTGVFTSLADHLLSRQPALPEHILRPLLEGVASTAQRERFFHWTLEFPEVFYPAAGTGTAPGFDAVIGNPPWEMLRGDRGSSDVRRESGRSAAMLTDFARHSGVYRLQAHGHANLYQLFVERSLALVRRGGRVGLVLPSGLATDHGCAALRRHLFDRTAVDTMVSIENRDGIFPIHRGLKFLLLTTTSGGTTASIPLRSGVRSAEALDDLPDVGRDPAAVMLPRELLQRVSGSQLAVPEVRTQADLDIVSRVTLDFPAVGDAEGWGLRFGRELNASDDKRHFSNAPRGLPVVEGKHIRPFGVDLTLVAHRIARSTAARLLAADRTFDRARLAYRDVASATNRLTLIAAVIPAGAVTTHTLFCLKDDVPDAVQRFLCGVFNSFVANYLVRLRVTTHVTAAIIGELRVPRPQRESAEFREIAELARSLAADLHDRLAYSRLQASVAKMYRLSESEFRHILSTFPLIDDACKQQTLASFAQR